MRINSDVRACMRAVSLLQSIQIQQKWNKALICENGDRHTHTLAYMCVLCISLGTMQILYFEYSPWTNAISEQINGSCDAFLFLFSVHIGQHLCMQDNRTDKTELANPDTSTAAAAATTTL